MNIWKHVRQLGRLLPFGNRATEQEHHPVTDHRTDEPIIQYGCDVCCNGIEDGSDRWHCGDCAASYDLCSGCYEKGEGTKHTETFGYLHELHLEKKGELASSRRVIADSLEQTIQNMFNSFAERPCIGVYVASRDRYEYLKFKEVGKLVSDFGSALHSILLAGDAHGITSPQTPPPMIALCSIVRLEWYIADYACCLLGIPTVGITATSDKDTVSFILSQTESHIAVCSVDLYPMFLSLAEETCLQLKEIIIMDLNENETVDISSIAKPVRSDLKVRLFSDMITIGSNDPVDLTKFTPDPDGIFTIAYTSGSTGNPKGCVFSRKLWLNHLNIPLAFLFGTKRIWFSFQPPSHMMERESFHLTLVVGDKAGIYRGSMEHLFDDMRMVRPTVITSTPRLYASIYNEYLQELHQEYVTCYKDMKERALTNDSANKQLEEPQIENETPPTIPEAPPIPSEFPKKPLIRPLSPSVELPDEFDPVKLPYELRDKVKQKFKKYFGGRERVIAVGGAAVPRELKSFLQFCFDAIVSEGYGTTEAGGISNGDWSMGDVTIELRDVPEMGYLTTDTPPRGEVCVKTKNMISGYYKNKDETSEKFQDGFFLTGDIAVMDTPGRVVIIDRKKNLFKLAQGEFVAPERIEGVYESWSNLVEQAYIYGNIFQNNVLAVIVPHKQALVEWTREKGGAGNPVGGDSKAMGGVETTENGEESASGKNRQMSEKEGVGERDVQVGSKEEHGNETIEEKIDSTDIEELCLEPEVYELFMSELRSLGQSHGLQGWEIPSGIILEPHPFTAQNHLLTSTMKKSRPQLEKKYKYRLEELYNKLETTSVKTKLSIEEEIFNFFLAELVAKDFQLPCDQSVGQYSSHINPALSLTQMGGDSMSAMRLSNIISSRLSLEISALTILKEPLINVLETILVALTGHLSHHHPSTGINGANPIDWDRETDISFLKNMSNASDTVHAAVQSTAEVKTVLVTGVTGFLGRFILWELLKDMRITKIYCLARSVPGISAHSRVFSMMKLLSSELVQNESDWLNNVTGKSRLVVLDSDLCKPRLGLSDEEYSLVKAEVDLIIHNGANVNHVLNYNDLKQSNVESTKEILKLCGLSRPKALHFVSSIGVFATLPWDTITEETVPDRKKLHILSGYSQSKWVCEHIISKAISEGFISAASISRPGLIGAHSVTGHPNRSDWFYVLVQGLKHMQRYPTGGPWDSGVINVIPVDTVAQSIVAISTAASGANTHYVHHLINTGSHGFISMSDIVQSLNRNGYHLSPTNQEEFFSILSEEARKDSASSSTIALHLLLSQGRCPFSPSRPVFTNKQTNNMLQSMKLSINLDDFPKPAVYMDQYIQYINDK